MKRKLLYLFVILTMLVWALPAAMPATPVSAQPPQGSQISGNWTATSITGGGTFDEAGALTGGIINITIQVTGNITGTFSYSATYYSGLNDWLGTSAAVSGNITINGAVHPAKLWMKGDFASFTMTGGGPTDPPTGWNCNLLCPAKGTHGWTTDGSNLVADFGWNGHCEGAVGTPTLGQWTVTGSGGGGWNGVASSCDAGKTQDIVAGSGNVTLSGSPDIASVSYNVTDNGTFVLAQYQNNPVGPPPGTKLPLDKYMQVDSNIVDPKINWADVELRVSYNNTDLSAANIAESSLRMYKGEGTNWTLVTNSGVNTTGNYVWAKLTSFSPYSPLGDMNKPPYFNDQATFPAEQAITGQDFTIFARTGDPEDTMHEGRPKTKALIDASDFETKLHHNITGSWASVSGTYVGAGFFKYTIPLGNLPGAGSSFDYYLKSTDSSGSVSGWSAYGVEFGACPQAPSNPWTVQVVAAGAGSISGDVYVNSLPVDNAWVFIDWLGVAVQTSADNFTFSNLPSGQYDIDAIYYNTSDNSSWEGCMDYIPTGATGLEIHLNPAGGGRMEEGGPEMGGMGNIIWTAPGEGMMGAPMDIGAAAGNVRAPILIAFNKAMDATTINADNITSDNITAAKIKLRKVSPDGTLMPCHTGYSVGYYDPDTKLVGGSNFGDFGLDPMAVIYTAPGNMLLPATQYVVKLMPTVTDTNGTLLNNGGGYVFSFGTSGGSFDYDMMDAAGKEQFGMDFGQGGMYMPPYVTSVTPMPGAFGVAKNSKVLLTFSEPMDATSLEQTSGTEGNIRIGKAGDWVNIKVELDSASKAVAVITPIGGFLTSGNYRVEVRTGAKSASGVPMGSPEMTGPVFQSDFEVDVTKTDSTSPTILGTSLDMYSNDVPLSHTIEIGFSEAMDPTTITANTIVVKRGTKAVTGTVKYDPGMQQAKFIPASAYSANTTYTLTVKKVASAGVKDLADNTLTADWTKNFTTTATADTEKPTLQYANADDYTVAVTFSEAMNAAQATDTTNWAKSVLNPANYILIHKFAPPDVASSGEAYSGGTFTSTDNLTSCTDLSATANITLSYDAASYTVKIKGLKLFSVASPGSKPLGGEIYPGFLIAVFNVADLSGNVIVADGTGGPVESSKETFGMMGPMTGGMMGPPSMQMGVGGMMEMAGPMKGGDFGMHDAGDMGMMGPMSGPLNMMAGAKTHYFFDLALQKQIPASGKIVLTFPSGFNVGDAALDTDNPCNSDINGPQGPGIVTIASVNGTKAQRTITIILGGTPTASPGAMPGGFGGMADFLHFQLKDIVNSVIPKGFKTSGYTLDVKTKDISGNILESFTTPPFFITKAGAYTVSGNITDGTSTLIPSADEVRVILGSPMTGPVDTFVATDGSFSFTGVMDGPHCLFTDPMVTVGGTPYLGSPMPEPLFISDNVTKNIVLELTTGIASANVTLIGDFRTGGVNDKVDIFAGSPSGFLVTTVTPEDASVSENYTIYFPSDDTWNVGIGPAMPMTMMMGPPPMPDWMPPQGKRVVVSGGVAQTNPIIFDITTNMANKQIIGWVTDGVPTGNFTDGTPVPDARVEAFSYTGMGMPSFCKTDSGGKFTLKVRQATYGINIWKPGIPPMPEKTVTVKADGTFCVDGKGYNQDGTGDKFIIKLKVASRTISGKVVDNADPDNANPVAYTPVWAYSLTTGEHIGSGTDSSGKFILYVRDGTWKVNAFVPNIGDLPETEVTVSAGTGSVSGLTLKPQAGVTYCTIEGTITIDGVAQKWTPIRAVKIEAGGVWGVSYGGSTDANGNYKITVPGTDTGYYRVDTWIPGYGELEPTNDEVLNNPANVIVGKDTDGSGTVDDAEKYRTGININYGGADVVTLNFAFENTDAVAAGTSAFIDVFDPVSGRGNGTPTDNVTTVTETLKVKKTGSYHIMAHIPGIGELQATKLDGVALTSGELVDLTGAGATANITFEFATGNSYTISGNVTISENLVTDGGFVWIGNPSLDYHNGTEISATGTYSFRVPEGAGYKIGADKPGYSCDVQTRDVAADVTLNLILTSNEKTISGNVTDEDGNPVDGAWVWADKVDPDTKLPLGGWAGASTDSTGDYTLSVGGSSYIVRANAPGYQETRYPGLVDLSATSHAANINIVLKPITGFVGTKPKYEPVTPSTGIFFEDKEGTGVKFVAPPGVLGSDTNAGSLEVMKKTAPKTQSRMPVGGMATDIKLKDSSGTSIKDLGTGTVDIEIAYDESWVTGMGYGTGDISLSHWNPDNKQWEEIPAVNDATNHILKAKVSSFSLFAPTLPSDTSAPTTPGTPGGTAGASAISLSWTASTDDVKVAGYEVYRSTSATGTFTNISGDAEPGGAFDASLLVSTNSYSDSTAVAGTTYYYKAAAFDTSGYQSASSSASGGVAISAAAAPAGEGGAPPPTIIVEATGLSAETSLKLDSSGKAKKDCQLTSLDEKVSLDIAKGTKLLDSKGKTLGSLSASEAISPPEPPAETAVVCAYDFGPDGATFEPAITLTMSYDPEALPEGVTEDELYIAYWDGLQWLTLEGTVDTEANTVSAETSHFTQFAVMGKLPPSLPPPTPAPASFAISDLSVTPSEVKPAEEVAILTKVTNTGGSEGKYTVVLKINGVEEARKEVTIDAGASQKVGFRIIKNIAATYEIDVNGLTGSFEVKEVVVPPVIPPPTMPKPINWPLLGGIIAGVIVVGLGIFFLVRRRTA